MITTTQLASDEYVGLGILKITTIPDISVIKGALKEEEALYRYRMEMRNLLTEIYQHYKNKGGNDIALEIFWSTEKVEDQTYQAKINLYLLARSIDYNASAAREETQMLLDLCKTTLLSQKYVLKQISFDQMERETSNVTEDEAVALVKEEQLENLQNRLLPAGYSFSRFLVSGQELSKLVTVLTGCPDCAVSFQLIPSYYNKSELMELDNVTQTLSTLSRGVTEQGIGSVSVAAADSLAGLYQYYSDNKYGALYYYNILVYGEKRSVDSISTQLFGQLNSSASGKLRMKFVSLQKDEADWVHNFYPLPWAVNEILINKDRDVQIWDRGKWNGSYYRMPYLITAEEGAELFSLPVGSHEINAGLSVDTSALKKKSYGESVINSAELPIGTVKSSDKKDVIGINLGDLTKHMLVVGTPGSGKTTFLVGMLDRLWKEYQIPFLVIEPAKNEYRAMLESIPGLQIFTPGKEEISPFVFNPFLPPDNVKLSTYKSTLKTAFEASVDMTSPLDRIFEETINNCYSDFMWLDTYTSADRGQVFNIADFIKCFQKTVEDIGYTGDAKNIGRAGEVRLRGLVNLFDNYYSIPIKDLLEKPTVIELSAIENKEEKALVTALLLLSVLAYVNSNYVGLGTLKNVILLEEAHVLLDRGRKRGNAEADADGIAVDLFKRMLAEVRSYGVGVVAADQSPRKVSEDVIGLTDIKLAFRLVEAKDKQMIADSTNMSELQEQHLSRLKTGEAFLFFHRIEEPEEIQTENYRDEHNIDITISDEELAGRTTYWLEKPGRLRPYRECGCTPYCKEQCVYGRRMLAKEIARRIYTKHFKKETQDFERVREVFARITRLIMMELNGEPFSPELRGCVKVYLWRKIKYDTRIPVIMPLIRASLEKG